MRVISFLESPQAEHFLLNMKHHRVLLVTGGGSFYSCGAEAWISPFLDDKVCEKYSGFQINPQLHDLEEGIALFSAFKPDVIIAVGGGSVLDMAKLIRFFAVIGVKPDAWIDGERSIVESTIECPLVAIPTTAGTGAEATHFAVLYRNGIKYSVAHQRVTPDHVILKPDFSRAMSSYLCAVSGMDAFSHAIESWWAKGSTEVSRTFSEKAISIILLSLPKAVAGDMKSRDHMLHAAYWAGRAIDIAKTTAAHAFSYVLTSVYGLPHGHAVAVLLPFFLEYNIRGLNSEESTALYNMLNMSPGTELIWGEKFISSLGLLLNIDTNQTELNNLFMYNVNLERLENNPVKLYNKEVGELAEYISHT